MNQRAFDTVHEPVYSVHDPVYTVYCIHEPMVQCTLFTVQVHELQLFLKFLNI